MTIRPTFRQADLARALKAAASAGIEVGRIEIDPFGNIVIIPAKNTPTPQNAVDEWISRHAG